MCDVIARYLDCWNETDPAARRKLIGEVWTPDAEYIDPMGEAHGRDAIEATIGRCRTSFPGSSSPWPARSTRTTGRPASPGVSGRRAVSPPVIGFDVAITAGNGQIVSVLGFLDKVPA